MKRMLNKSVDLAAESDIEELARLVGLAEAAAP